MDGTSLIGHSRFLFAAPANIADETVKLAKQVAADTKKAVVDTVDEIQTSITSTIDDAVAPIKKVSFDHNRIYREEAALIF